LFDLILARFINSVFTLPDLNDWIEAIFLLFVYGAIALPIGFQFGFLQWSSPKSSTPVTRILLTSLFAPAILEEIFFRVLLLPHRNEKASVISLCISIAISLVLFVVYHPLNALTFFPAGRKTFFKPIFLFLATCLGISCTIAYLHSGSLWVATFVHWVIVIVWLLFFGGYDRLKKDSSP
jgi:predicted Abi (CAAX) family protease